MDPPASANDSSAQLAAGGLVLAKSDAIALLSEDLFISAKQVRIKYVFLNTGPSDVTTEVAFPLPDITPDLCKDGGDVQWPNEGSENFVGFVTKVDGTIVVPKVELKAFRKDKEITSDLRRLGLLLPPGRAIATAVDSLSRADRKRLEGLLDDDSGCGDWTLRTIFHRPQTFPAGRFVTVEHSYAPVVGSYVGSIIAGDGWEEGRRAMVRKYCVDGAFQRAVARARRKRARAAREADWADDAFSEITIGYILKSGANWAGPIREFRLVVDKGAPENLVSFCATGLRRISPTQFELRKKDFTPTDDINLVILVPYPKELPTLEAPPTSP